MSARHVLAIARLTVREAMRRRVLWVLFSLSVGSVAIVAVGVDRLVDSARAQGMDEVQVRIGVSQVLILIAFMFSFVLAMSAAFLGAPAIASDVESGSVLAILARPTSRADLIVGRWLGLSVVVVAYVALSGVLAIAAVGLVSGHVPPEPALAVAYLAGESVLVLTVALMLGTRLASVAAGAISVVLFALSWFAGVLGALAASLDVPTLRTWTDAVRLVMPTDVLWRGVVYGLEPPLVVLLSQGRRIAALDANPFFASAPPPAGLVVWAVAWVVLTLLGALLLFRRREL